MITRVDKFIQEAYDTLLRPYLPYKICVRNGVAVGHVVKILDRTDNYPEYEQGLISHLRKSVMTGDKVVIIGGGEGVSSVVAAEQAGPGGEVTTFEASREQLEIAEETLTLNCVNQRVTLQHTLVGPNIQTIGVVGHPKDLPPSEIPACDVLEMDCEGSELEILENLSVRPRTIVVEVHDNLGSSEADVREELSRLDYEVVSKSPHGFPMSQNRSEKDGVFVLRAVKTEQYQR